MAIYCPIIKEDVLYLDCKDCDDTVLCRQLKLCGLSEDNDKNTIKNIDNKTREEGAFNYEKDC